MQLKEKKEEAHSGAVLTEREHRFLELFRRLPKNKQLEVEELLLSSRKSSR